MDKLVLEFTIGLIGAIVGGLIVGRLDRRLAAGWKWYRAHTETASVKREHIISALVADPTILAVAYLDTFYAIGLLIAGFFMVVFITSDINAITEPPWALAFALADFLMAVSICLLGFLISRRIACVQEASSRLFKSRGIPKAW